MKFTPTHPHLLPSQLRDLSALLQQFQIVFQDSTILPPHRPSDHAIPLKPNMGPINTCPFHYWHYRKDQMESMVSDMLAVSIISPSSSPFSSLVCKKDGSSHFCIDYQMLNKATLPNKYPIPMIQELLDELHGTKYFLKIDLKASYHQIQFWQPNVHKIPFCTHFGHCEFVVMPFGLTNMLAIFQSTEEQHFQISFALFRFILVFYYILVYSKSWIQPETVDEKKKKKAKTLRENA